MMAAVLKGLVLGLMLSISVGPVIFSIIRQSITNGHRGGFLFITGVSASDVTVVLACNLFTHLFHTAMKHEKVIGISGSIFLIVLGIYTIFFKKVIKTPEQSFTVKRYRKRDMAAVVFSGFLMNTLNPGVFLFWFAASASIMEDASMLANPGDYRLVVFSTCLLLLLLGDILKVLLAGRIRTKLTPHNIHLINKMSGFILACFGLFIMWGIVSGKVMHQ